MRRVLWVTALVLAAGCVGPEDDPTSVHDLRVLGMATTPSELMASTCEFTEPSPQDLLTFASEVQLRVLIADPAGEGREISYELWTCADREDPTCAQSEDNQQSRVLLAQGTAFDGELLIPLRPALVTLEDGTALLQRIIEVSPSLSRVWVPLSLYLRAGDEAIYAQKLMTYSCRLLPQMLPNQEPVLENVFVEDQLFDPSQPVVLTAQEEFDLRPEAFTDRQESYVLPSFRLEPVELEERWELNWYTDYGAFSPGSTGGANPGGGELRHNVVWRPPFQPTERDVRFWLVIRDGRGGTTWLQRTARFRP